MAEGQRLRVAWILASLCWIAASLPLRPAAENRVARPRFFQRQSAAASETVEPYNFDTSASKSNGHFALDSTSSADWPRQRSKWRKRLLSSSEGHAAELKKLARDDEEGDSFLWGNLSEFAADDTSKYWDDLCNGTNLSKNNTLPGDIATSKLNVSVVLSSWKLQNNSTCSEFAGTAVFTDALEAFKECGAPCDGLSFTQLNASTPSGEIRLCAVGGFRKQVNSSLNFVYNKPADFVSPKGQPRPPMELGFWRDFCTYRAKGRKLRIMFEGQNCADNVVKALTAVSNPVECSEAAAKDADCSNVFDFRFGPPTLCRCLKKDTLCSPILSTAGHVYAPSLQ